MNLGRSTLSSITTNDVTGLYATEWPETKKMLIADHRVAIEQDKRSVRRWLRTGSAVFYGLAQRLAPHRRMLFVLSQVAFFLCLFSIFTQMNEPPLWTFIEVTATFLMMTVLLAMELIDKIKIRDELVLARDLQSSLIPHTLPPSPDYELAAFHHIANTVGGDIYDFVPLEDGRMAVLFGDASGHGMSAGLVMAVAHAAFRTQLEVDPAPSAISSSLNRILCRTGGPRAFFAFCYVLFSPDGNFVATVAGHPQMLKLDRSGRVADRIGRGAYPLGVKAAMWWEEVSGHLAPGQSLLLHSDGLTEARNTEENDFGDERIEAVAALQVDAPPQRLVENLVAEWQIFMQGRPTEDDVTLAAIRRRI